MAEWLERNRELVFWLGVFSVASLVAAAVALPIFVARLPADYFAHTPVEHKLDVRHSALAVAGRAVKNVVGGLLVLAGIAMLVLPGQGVLTILIGLTLMNFPGKFALERKIVARKPVLTALNWIRRKTGHPPLIVGAHSSATADDGG